ncbi:MAG: helix-turn-helix transcriptional regulator [Candidatus Krumholzibacteriota bacterium]|nr:helix-turn-helix transcriptional regulator [Candidatus Krumholzibacteriota bacterium]
MTGSALRTLRRDRGWSRWQLALMLDWHACRIVDADTIAAWESGRLPLTPAVIRDLALCFLGDPVASKPWPGSALPRPSRLAREADLPRGLHAAPRSTATSAPNSAARPPDTVPGDPHRQASPRRVPRNSGRAPGPSQRRRRR